MERIGNDWDGLLADEFAKEYFGKLEAFVEGERSRGEVIRRQRMFSTPCAFPRMKKPGS